MPSVNLNISARPLSGGFQQEQNNTSPPNTADTAPLLESSNKNNSLPQPTIESPLAASVTQQYDTKNAGNQSADIQSNATGEGSAGTTSQPGAPFASSAGDLPDNSWIFLFAGSGVLIGIAVFWILSKILSARRRRMPRLAVDVDPGKEVRGQFRRANRFDSATDASTDEQSKKPVPAQETDGIENMESDTNASFNSEEFDYSADLDDLSEQPFQVNHGVSRGNKALNKKPKKTKAPKQTRTKETSSKRQRKVETLVLVSSSAETLREMQKPAIRESEFEDSIFCGIQEDDFTVESDDSDLYDDSEFDMESPFGQGDLDMDSAADEDSVFEAEIRASESNRFSTGMADDEMAIPMHDDEDLAMNVSDDDSDADFDFELDGEEVEFGDSDSNFDFDMDEKDSAVASKSDASNPAPAPAINETNKDSDSAEFDAMFEESNDDLTQAIAGTTENDVAGEVADVFAGEVVGSVLPNQLNAGKDKASKIVDANQAAVVAEGSAATGGLMSKLFGWMRGKNIVQSEATNFVGSKSSDEGAATQGSVASSTKQKSESDSGAINTFAPETAETIVEGDSDSDEFDFEAVPILNVPVQSESHSTVDQDLAGDKAQISFGNQAEFHTDDHQTKTPGNVSDSVSFELEAPEGSKQDNELDLNSEDEFSLAVKSTGPNTPLSSRDTLPEPEPKIKVGIVEPFTAADLANPEEVASAFKFTSADTLRDTDDDAFDEVKSITTTAEFIDTHLNDDGPIDIDDQGTESKLVSPNTVELESKINELSLKNATLADLVATLEAKVSDNESAELEKSNLTNQLETKEKECEELVSNLEAAKAELEKTKSESNSNQDLLSKTDAELNELRENLDSIRTEKENLASQLSESQALLTEKNAALAEIAAGVEPGTIAGESESIDVADLKRRFELRLKAERKTRKEAQQNLVQAEEQRNDIAAALRAAKKEIAAAKEEAKKAQATASKQNKQN